MVLFIESEQNLKYGVLGNNWQLALSVHPDFTETDYLEPVITTGSYEARFPNFTSSTFDIATLIFCRPTMSPMLLRTIRIDANAERFLDAYAMWPAIDAAERLRTELESKALLDMTLLLERDSEAQDREELVLVYSLHNLAYKEILQLWNEASRRLQKLLPASIAKRVYVRLTKA